ncbi:hypothetical protein PENTCL1PPCAC_2623, partial [Pristionchus entomophagus]
HHASRASVHSRGGDGWDQTAAGFGGEEGGTQNGYVHVPSHHASRTSVNSRGGHGWDQNATGFAGDNIGAPVQLPRHESRASVHSRGADGWDETGDGFGGEGGGAQNGHVHVPSHHASRTSMHSRGIDGWDETTTGLGGDEIGAPVQLSRHASRHSLLDDAVFGQIPSHHASRMSVTSHRSVSDTGHVVGSKLVQVDGFGSRAPSHHASRASVYSSVSRGGIDSSPEGIDEWGEETVIAGHPIHIPEGERELSRGPSRSASKTSVKLDAQDRDEWDKNEQVFGGGGGVSHASRHSLHSGIGSKAPSHHSSKVSIHSHAGGDAGIVPFTVSRPQSVRASRTSIYSHTAGDARFGSRAPSHYASRASIHSNVYAEEEEEIVNDGMDEFIPEERSRTSGTSTRSQLSCIACADDDTEEGVEEEEKKRERMPQLGDEIEVPPEAAEEWGEHGMREEEERMMENMEYRESGHAWGANGAAIEGYVPQMEKVIGRGVRGQQRSAFGSRTSVVSHPAPAPSIGGRSHHASRMSMRSNLDGMDENDDGGHGLQMAEGGSMAPIPAIRLSRASLNQPNMDWNHNSMGSLNGGGEFTDQNQIHIPSHHASKQSLRSVRSERALDPIMQTALSKTSVVSQRNSPRDRRFSSRSTQDVAEWGETVNDEEEEVFDHHGGYGEGEEYDRGMSRGTSHRSIYSTRSSKAGEQTEENLLQARLNRSREQSLASLGDGPYIPPKDGWKSSAFSVKSTNEEEGKHRSRRHSRSSSVHLVGTGIDLRDEVVIPVDLPIPKTRSRSASIASRRSFEGVVFAEQPELYAHPDERFGGGDKTIEGIPFRRTNEHEKTPQPSSKRGSKVFKHSESEDELRALVSSASASHTSVVDNTRPPSAGFHTPKSRNSRESYVGTGEISMPSPSPFNQTHFQKEEYEAFKEREARASATGFLPFSPSHDRNEMSTQTGETIARAAGQQFAIHYGGDNFPTLSAKPRRGVSGGLPPSATSSAYSMAPPPPSCSPPHEEETPCLLQHHQPMGEEEMRKKRQERQYHPSLYDHGDVGATMDGQGDSAMRKTSSNSSRFAPLPTYDMSYVEQYEARSMASVSKTTTTSTSVSSSTLKSQQQQGSSAASSYVDHLRLVQPSPAHTNVALREERGGVEREMERTATHGGYYRQEEALISPSKGSVAQKAAAFRQKEEAERMAATGTHQEYTPVYRNYLQQHLTRPMTREVPIEVVRGGGEGERGVSVERENDAPKTVKVEMKRAPSSLAPRPMQQSGYVQIERPKMNNSFERNNHPAAAVLNSMLSARAGSSLNSSRSDDNPVGLTRQPSSVGGTSGGGGGYILPYPMGGSGNVPPAPPLPSLPYQSMGGMPKGVMTSPTTGGYQRSIRPLASEDATFHYEMKHDLSSQQMHEQRMNEQISKDEQSVLSRVGAIRADVSPKGITQMGGRQPMRSREAQRAYDSYHDKKSEGAPSIPLTSAPKPFTPSSPYRSVALGQQQQVYGAFRAQTVPQAPIKQPQQLQPMSGEKEMRGEKTAVGPIEQNKYTGSTIRRAIPQRGHIRNLAAAFDTIQTKADREVTVIEPHNTSVLQRQTSTVGGTSSGGERRAVGGGSTSSATSSARGFAPRSEGMQQNRGGDGQDAHYRVPVQLQQQLQHTGTTTTTSGSMRMEREERAEMDYEMRRSGYDERTIHEWQSANEQQQRHVQQREEQAWSGGVHEDEEELCLDSESDRPTSIPSGGGRRAGGGGGG